jgi:hypothetical protein
MAIQSSYSSRRDNCRTDRFDDPNLPGEMTVTVRLKKVSVGTEVNIVQEGMANAQNAS